ncbi:hypothetical protein Acor_74020 [Acrocarpospora corrugata]|uniref:HTH luxR-type domain-containing protein n=1 Tax=Acrocarpospora corrugata TaxID=35763 RepID=A0A5M3W8Y9_9ACTN|nr:helix-turn-helix transcriptional regulator [Acrocarpospora corrugata]GES05334.1 hypothetical protein Acor_74020 [Acrocarpospora corrugata]
MGRRAPVGPGDRRAGGPRRRDLARAHDLPAFELIALHDLVRLGAAEQVRDRLDRVAAGHDGELAPLFAEHARAAGDGAALLAVADRFDRLGFTLFAAEAAAQAADACRDDRSLAFARARAYALASRCEGADTPALSRVEPPGLTPSESKVAQLAAEGKTTKDIAAELVLSRRTVDNHLRSVYRKLGIHRRDGLRQVVSH